jgi:GNAT superfamily N-acetyltransferase
MIDGHPSVPIRMRPTPPTIRVLHGAEILTALDALAALRIRVFRDWPYLYDGDLTYERTYLTTYAASPRAFCALAEVDGVAVGATTAVPLADETAEVQAPFLAAGIDPATVCYFGESVLLPEYRGLGLGHRFFDLREAAAAAAPGISHTAFCAVERPADHPRRPADYRPLDAFWRARGYAPRPELTSWFHWKDLDEPEETAKPMRYWMRALPERAR